VADTRVCFDSTRSPNAVQGFEIPGTGEYQAAVIPGPYADEGHNHLPSTLVALNRSARSVNPHLRIVLILWCVKRRARGVCLRVTQNLVSQGFSGLHRKRCPCCDRRHVHLDNSSESEAHKVQLSEVLLSPGRASRPMAWEYQRSLVLEWTKRRVKSSSNFCRAEEFVQAQRRRRASL
jgi:hypothetical protein